MSFAIFAIIFGLINDPLRAAVDGTIGSLTAWLLPIIRVTTIIVLITTIIGVAVSDNVSANIPTGIVVKILLRAAILVYLLSGAAIFTQYITGPLLNLPNELSNVILNGNGAPPITQGGQQFDILWVHTYAADVKAAQRASFWTTEGWLLGAVAFASAVFSGLFIGYMFVKYLVAYVRLTLTAAVSPLFIASLIARHTRHWFAGWLNGAASGVLVLVLISVLLSVLMKAQQTQIDLVMNAPANANILGMIGSSIGVAILCFVGCCVTHEIPGYAVGLVGGIYQEGERMFAPVVSAMSSAGGGIANWFGGGNTATAPAGGVTANQVAAGRSLSGRGP